MIVICQNDFPIGVLPGATEEQAEAFIKKMRADSDAAITDPNQARPAFHWHDVPEMKARDWSDNGLNPVSCPYCKKRADARELLTLAEQWEREAAECRRDGYIDAAVVKEECAQRIRQTLGISAIAESLAQQPAAVDEAMVERAAAAVTSAPPGISVEAYVRIALEAALAQQPGKRYIDADIALAILREALAQQFIAAAAKDAEAEARAKRLVEALQEARQMIRDLLPDTTFTKWDALLCDQKEANEHRALTQQPAAVDEAMVDRAFAFCGYDPLTREDVHKMLTAALAQQPAATAAKDAEIEVLLAELDFRDSVIATHAADTREYQKRISQAEACAKRLAEALRNSADALERLAFAIRAPNAHTPQLVELAIAMRTAALAQQPEARGARIARRRDVRLWMRHNAGFYDTATELAEAADDVFHLPDGALDNETHWVWDEAVDAINDAQREERS